MKKRRFTTLTLKKNGKTYKKSVSYNSLQDLAEKKLAFEKECEESEKHLFKDVADQWQETHEKAVEHYTAESYKAPLKDLKAEFGEMEIKDITAPAIQSFLGRMALQGYARQTINLRKTVLSQVIDYAVFTGMIQYNVAKVCKIPKAAHEIRLPPADEEIEKIKNAPDSMWKIYFLLLMYSGLRREEALALKKEDLDFENCTLSVNKVLIFKSNVPVIRNTAKSAAGIRLAPFPKSLHRYFINAKNGLIFNHNGNILNKGQFDHGTERFKKENGITCNSHQLRHYFATMCHGVIDAKDAQHILGHSKVSTTLDIYTNLDREKKLKAIEIVNNFIDKNNTKNA